MPATESLNIKAENFQPLVSDEKLKSAAYDNAPSWCRDKSSSVDWVNWRESSVQIKFYWSEKSNFSVYVDFKAKSRKESRVQRDTVLKKMFELHASHNEKPFQDIDGHLNYGFKTPSFVSPNQAFSIAKEMGFECTVIYAIEISREIMTEIGLPIVAGETGKEWIGGEYHSYKPKPGCNL